jgi:hypothetical protein
MTLPFGANTTSATSGNKTNQSRDSKGVTQLAETSRDRYKSGDWFICSHLYRHVFYKRVKMLGMWNLNNKRIYGNSQPEPHDIIYNFFFSNPFETIKRKAWKAALMMGTFIVVLLVICACIRSDCCCRLCYCICVTCCPNPAPNREELQMEPLRPRNSRAIEYHIEDP